MLLGTRTASVDTRVKGDQSFKPFNARRFVSAKLPQQRTQPTRLVHGENGECVLSLSLSPGKYEVTPRSKFTYSKLISNCICFACVYAIPEGQCYI